MAQAKMGWDYGLASRGEAEGKRVAAQRSRNNTAALMQQQRNASEMARSVANNNKAVEAQELANDALYKKTYDTFVIPQNDNIDYSAVNTMWDTTTNRMVDAFHSISKNTDLSPRDSSYQKSILMRQVQPMADGRKIMEERIADYLLASASGTISKSMPVKYQEMYAELANNKFDGDIEIVDDKLRIYGKTESGHEIDMNVQDFDAHMPKTSDYVTGSSLLTILNGQGDLWKEKAQKFKKSGKEQDRPKFDRDVVMKSVQETVSNFGAHGEEKFAVDTMGWTKEKFEKSVADKMLNKQTVYGAGISEKQYNSMSDEMKLLYPPREEEVTMADAEMLVMKDLQNQYADAAQWSWNKTGYSTIKPNPKELTKEEKYDLDFRGVQLNKVENLQQAIIDKDFKTILNGIGNDTNVASDGALSYNKNGDPVFNYTMTEYKGDKEYPKNVSVNLTDDDAVERFYKNFIKNDMSQGKSTEKVDIIWEEIKPTVYANLSGINQQNLNADKEAFPPNELVDEVDYNQQQTDLLSLPQLP